MSDKELIDYCEAHSKTPVGMIHKGMIKRLCEIGGVESAWVESQEWWRVDPYTMKEVCEAARLKLEEAAEKHEHSN